MLKNKGHIPFPDLWRIAFVFVHYSILSIKGGPGKSGAVHSAINRKEAGAVINVLKRLLLELKYPGSSMVRWVRWGRTTLTICFYSVYMPLTPVISP